MPSAFKLCQQGNYIS